MIQNMYNDQKQKPGNDLEYVYEHIVGTEYRAAPNALDINFREYGIDILEEGELVGEETMLHKIDENNSRNRRGYSRSNNYWK